MRLRGLAAICLALGASALAAPAASADWRAPEDLGPDADQGLTLPVLAGNARGDAVAAWLGPGGVDVAVSRRGRGFGPARRVPSSTRALAVRVAVNERGKAVVAWLAQVDEERTRVRLAGLNVDGGFGRSRAVTYAAMNLGLGPVAIGPGGRVAFSFTLNDSALSRASDPSGHFSHIVAPPEQRTFPFAVSYAGTRPRLLYGRPDERFTALYERAISRSAGVRTRTVATGLPRDARIHVASASNGVQAAVWAPGHGDAPRDVFAATRRPGARFAGRAVQRRVPPMEVRAAVAPSGAALVAWPEFNEAFTDDLPSNTPDLGPPGRITTSYRAPGGSFRSPRSYRPVPEDAIVNELRLAVDSRGRGAIGWHSARMVGGGTRVLAARQVRGGALRDVQGLTTYDDRGQIGDVAVDSRGRATLDWWGEGRIFGIRGGL